MIVFDTLIKSCHTHVPLFGKHVVASCKLLLTTRPQCSAAAVSTFKTYVMYLDDMTQLDWVFFVQHFNKMIAPTASDDSKQVVGGFFFLFKKNLPCHSEWLFGSRGLYSVNREF